MNQKGFQILSIGGESWNDEHQLLFKLPVWARRKVYDDPYHFTGIHTPSFLCSFHAETFPEKTGPSRKKWTVAIIMMLFRKIWSSSKPTCPLSWRYVPSD